ncbi:MAG TPA: GDP-L-fucose synthase [Solirubrobacterales bacterium]|nr:GDP-L-fucose synthase [Solirubrobacterales bacterium]
MSGGAPAGSRPDPGFWSGRSVAVTGGGGFLGKPVMRMLGEAGADASAIRSADFDLRDGDATREALEGTDVVFHLAANVGGIGYNRRNPAPLAHDNMAMGLNVFEACRDLGVDKLVAACSVCAYPLETPVPFREETIWDGYPEPSNAPYGLAKKMLIVLSDTYRRQYEFDSCAPVIANLYGPDDNFDLNDSHVIAAMVRKYVEAAADGHRDVTLWGSGEPSREFLYVDDAARGLILCAERLEVSEPVNLGVGRETRIRDLAEAIAAASGFEGETVWDSSMPDGQMKRGLDVTKARELAGFEAEVSLEEGIERTVEWFREHELEPAAA